MKTIAICSSANFYKQAVEVEAQLEKLGYKVLLPISARRMKAANDFTVQKSWYENPDDYHKKTVLIRAHFDEIAKSDVCLVLNYEKHGVPNYIGGNVLMEMAVAFHLKKPIYILNELPTDSAFEEEIRGMESVALHGKLEDISQAN